MGTLLKITVPIVGIAALGVAAAVVISKKNPELWEKIKDSIPCCGACNADEGILDDLEDTD